MTKRKWAWVGICAMILFVAAGTLWSVYGKTEIVMTRAELQAKIDDKMPFTTKNGVVVSDVKLDLSGGEIGISLAANADKFGTKFDAAGKTRGNLRYDNLKGSFYCRNSELELTRLKADEQSISDKVNGLINKWVDSPKILANKDEISGKAAEVATGLVLKGAEFTLERIPVYTLPSDFKGNIARMFLKDVEVKGDTIVAHLSFWQFTKMLFFYGFVLIVSVVLAIGLMMNPEWGIPILLLGSLGD